MEKNYVIKAVTPKVWDWKILGYSISYYHRNYPDWVQSVFYWLNDMKIRFKVENENQANSLVGQSCSIEKNIVL